MDSVKKGGKLHKAAVWSVWNNGEKERGEGEEYDTDSDSNWDIYPSLLILSNEIFYSISECGSQA